MAIHIGDEKGVITQLSWVAISHGVLLDFVVREAWGVRQGCEGEMARWLLLAQATRMGVQGAPALPCGGVWGGLRR